MLSQCSPTRPARLRLARPADVPLLVAETPGPLLGSIATAIYGDPSRELAVVGITGTSGKTTTCYLLEAALAADGSKTGLIGTVQTRIDGEVAPSALTTPEAPDLQALFAVMVERGVERGGDGGVVARAVAWAGSAEPPSPSALSPT